MMSFESRCARSALAALALAAVACAEAQTPAPPPAPAAPAPLPPIEFKSVAAALSALEARDGNGTVVVHSDGWTIVNEPLATAQWSFAPKDHVAYPAVVRRVVRREGGQVSVDIALLCENSAENCGKLRSEFEALSERVTQAIKARGRQGSSAAAPPPQ